MKCEKCREIKLCRTINFGGINDDDKKLYLCKDCSHWMYSYIMKNVCGYGGDDSNDSEEEQEKEIKDPSLCFSCKKNYTDVDDISDNMCKHCEYHEWYGKHYR